MKYLGRQKEMGKGHGMNNHQARQQQRRSDQLFFSHFSFRSSLLLVNSSSYLCGATGMEVADAEAAGMLCKTGSTTLSSSSS